MPEAECTRQIDITFKHLEPALHKSSSTYPRNSQFDALKRFFYETEKPLERLTGLAVRFKNIEENFTGEDIHQQKIAVINEAYKQILEPLRAIMPKAKINDKLSTPFRKNVIAAITRIVHYCEANQVSIEDFIMNT